MPYLRKAKYTHNRLRDPIEFKKGTIRTVPISRVPHTKKYPKGTKAIVGKLKETGKGATQSILIPKKKK